MNFYANGDDFPSSPRVGSLIWTTYSKEMMWAMKDILTTIVDATIFDVAAIDMILIVTILNVKMMWRTRLETYCEVMMGAREDLVLTIINETNVDVAIIDAILTTTMIDAIRGRMS